MRSFLIISLTLASVLAGCDDTDDVAPTVLNFNRPIDMAFACYGSLRITGGSAATADQTIENTAQPTEACNIRSGAAGSGGITPVPPGQEDLGGSADVGTSAWYAFVLQSVPGTVGIATFETQPAANFTGIDDVTVLDADPLTPGKSGFTMGVQPVGLVTDAVGCYEVTANAGSCDLSALDITRALSYQSDPQGALDSNEPVRINSLPIVNANGIPLRAKPAAIVAQPPGGTIGVTCAQTPSGLVYVAYPSCHLVAGIDLSTGTVTSAIEFDTSGTPSILAGSDLASVTCPDECSGGGQTTPGPRPTSLDLQLDPRSSRRALAIGSENSNIVTIAELARNYLPTSTSPVVLENTTGTLGVNQVKIGPEIGMGGDLRMIDDGMSPGPDMQFLYAIATDASVRVANILNSVNTECDTQVDPRFLRNNKDVAFLSCMPVGGSGSGAPTPPRRAGAIGPGIVLVNRMPAINTTTTTTSTSTNPVTTLLGGTAALTPPMGIDIFQIPAITGAAPGPTTMIGYFGVISGANGQTYILNVDDDGQPDYVGESNNATNGDENTIIGSQIPLDIANQIRDSLPDRGQVADETINSTVQPICDTDGPDPDDAAGNQGGARSSGVIGTELPTFPETVVATDKIPELPSIQQVLCTGADAGSGTPVAEISFPAAINIRDAVYPDIMGMSADETWYLTYEGDVSVDTLDTAANGPPVREGMWTTDATGMSITDQALPFCAAGTQPWDILQVRGCDPTLGNADCPPDYDCFVHPDSQVQGIGQCMLSTEADRLSDACKEFLVSERRYTIAQATSGKITLLPRKHVLRTSPIDGCTNDGQCQMLADYALQNNSPNNAIDDTTAPDTHKWTCILDPDRAPDLDGSGNVIKRCVESGLLTETAGCVADSDCDAGTVCQAGICMEGIVPPQSCVNAAERYEVDVGEAYAVAGSVSGFHHNIIADANGNCINNPNGSPFNIGRIPLHAPACVAATGLGSGVPDLGINGDGTLAGPNPCETTVDQWELENQYELGTCTFVKSALVDRKADAIVFRGPAFTWTIVDPTYPGDATCIGDRLGNLGKIPIVPTGTQLSVRITGGFRPLFLDIQPALPGKVVRGPTESIWVIDQGDYLSQDVDIASTEGKVFRVESQAIGVVNVLE
ncbi:MAG TPA: hypothetical protein VH143_03925 [Kofleriaceae bacterium]|jgi:hypothetical protein|nr:hypothetical protein [Kofleriaceae bacterium]